ncbi:MAG: hypothetical protein ACKOCV_02070 [Gemmatimonadota bacterium]
MFPRDLYEIIHLIGIALTMAALGATALHALEGGTRRGPRARRVLVALYGGGLFLILLGGFGMLARLGIARAGVVAFPGWLWAKLAVWALLGAVMLLPYRRPTWGMPMLRRAPLLIGLATYFALYKPI